MATYNRIYPAGGRVQFDGGQNNKFEKSIILDNESPDCQNVVFSNGAVETRLGIAKLNSNAVGAYACDGLFTRRSSAGAENMLAWFNGTMHQWDGVTFVTHASSQSIFEAGRLVTAAEFQDYMFMCDGASTPYKYNGVEFTRHGVQPPTATATVASTATGALTGQYRYKVTYVNSMLVEGDVGPVTATFTAASATLGLTSVPVAPASYGVNARRIYRNTAASGTVYYLAGTISDNTTTTYSDTTADGSLGAAAPTDAGLPPTYKTVIYHQSRLFMTDKDNPNYIWYSDLNAPYTVATTNFLRIGDASGDIVRGLAVFDNSIVCLCERAQWIIYMADTDPTNWRVVKVRASYGCKSTFAHFYFKNKVMFPAVQSDKLAGFAAISGDTLEPSATLLTVSAAGSELQTEPIEPDIFDINDGQLDKITSIVFQNVAYISAPNLSSLYNNRIFVFDFSSSDLAKKQKQSWVPWTGINARCFTIYEGTLYCGNSNGNGRVYEMNATNTYSDDGVAIDSYFWTKEFAGLKGDENTQKDFRFAKVLRESVGNWGMGLTYKVDGDINDGTVTSMNLDPGGSLWGTMVWGTDSWGGGYNEAEERVYLGASFGKRIQFKFDNQNTIDQHFKVIGLNFQYNIKGQR